jgi:predicted transposase YdaD
LGRIFSESDHNAKYPIRVLIVNVWRGTDAVDGKVGKMPKILVSVVYFLPPGEQTTIEKNYHRDFMGQTAHQDFQVISLWELEAEKVLKFNNPVLLPFIPLMQGGNTAEMLEICVSNIREQEKEQAADLEALLAVLAGYVLDPKLINQLLRWEMQLVHHSPIIQELLLEKFQSGEQKGRYQEILKAIQKALKFRFSVETTVFEEKLRSLNLKALEQLEDEAFTVQTLAEFEKVLNSMMA